MNNKSSEFALLEIFSNTDESARNAAKFFREKLDRLNEITEQDNNNTNTETNEDNFESYFDQDQKLFDLINE